MITKSILEAADAVRIVDLTLRLVRVSICPACQQKLPCWQAPDEREFHDAPDGNIYPCGFNVIRHVREEALYG